MGKIFRIEALHEFKGICINLVSLRKWPNKIKISLRFNNSILMFAITITLSCIQEPIIKGRMELKFERLFLLFFRTQCLMAHS